LLFTEDEKDLEAASCACASIFWSLSHILLGLAQGLSRAKYFLQKVGDFLQQHRLTITTTAHNFGVDQQRYTYSVMSGLFSKRPHMIPLLAMKPSPAFRFPTRSLITSANVYSGIGPKEVHNDEASGNAKTGKPFTLRDDEHSVCQSTSNYTSGS